jgi:hypothetical protein
VLLWLVFLIWEKKMSLTNMMKDEDEFEEYEEFLFLFFIK